MTATSESVAAGVPRILRGLEGADARLPLAAHLRLWGPLGHLGPHLIDVAEEAGLRGRGGAGFPVATKWRAVAAGSRPVLIANGAEGEPASAKDALLLERTPHLVLDGAAAAAAAVGARRIVLYTGRRRLRSVQAAVDERRARGIDAIDVEIVEAPDRFLSGQESAATNAISLKPALPSFTAVNPVWRRGVDGRPTLVQNVETLAHVALLARFGARWFAGAGTAAEPGTGLLTVSPTDGRPVVLEAEYGTPLVRLVGRLDRSTARGVLIGGFGGSWVDTDVAAGLRFSEEAARAAGATFGPGIVAMLPPRCCPLAETARIARYLADQGAGQCGPCARGLPTLAYELEELAFGRLRSTRRQPADRIAELCDLVEGRGACRHPDGAARLVRSALAAFPHEVHQHQAVGPCPEVAAAPFLPTGTARRSTGSRR